MKSNPKSLHDASLDTLFGIESALEQLQTSAANACYLVLALQRQIDEILHPARRLRDLEPNPDIEGVFMICAVEQGLTSLLVSSVDEKAREAWTMAKQATEALSSYRSKAAEAMSCVK